LENKLGPNSRTIRAQGKAPIRVSENILSWTDRRLRVNHRSLDLPTGFHQPRIHTGPRKLLRVAFTYLRALWSSR